MSFPTVKTSEWKKKLTRKRRRRGLWPERVWKRIVDCFIVPPNLNGPVIQVADWLPIVREANAESE